MPRSIWKGAISFGLVSIPVKLYSATEAFVLLRRHSQHTNRRLRRVAADLITRVTGCPPEPGRDFDRDDELGG